MRMTKFVETAWTVDKHFSAVHHKHTKNIYYIYIYVGNGRDPMG